MNDQRVGFSSTTDDGLTERLQSEQLRVFWPFFIGTDNPISYLYQKIAPHFESTEFDIRVLSSGGADQPQADNIRVVPASDFYTWAGRLAVARHAVAQYDLLHTGGIPLLHYPVSLLSRIRNRNLTAVHTYRIDADPDAERTPTAIRRRLGKQAK